MTTTNDPIADMLTRIRNANSAYKPGMTMPSSKKLVEIARILKEEGYIANFKATEEEGQRLLRVYLKYGPNNEATMSQLARISRPGCRVSSAKFATVSSPVYASSNTRTTSSATARYRVQPGDTLGSIAERNGVEVSSLKGANNMKGSTIMAGQVLVIPSGGYSSANSSDNGISDKINYRVKKGDTLSGIAQKYDVSVSTLKQANKMKSNDLTPGQKLRIP